MAKGKFSDRELKRFLSTYFEDRVQESGYTSPPPLYSRGTGRWSGVRPVLHRMVTVAVLAAFLVLIYHPFRTPPPLAKHMEQLSRQYQLGRTIENGLVITQQFLKKYYYGERSRL
jgi:type II secretory pathway component PulM